MTRSLLITASIFLAFVSIAFFVPPDPMNEVLSAAVFVAAAFGMYRWAPAALRVFASGARTEESWGILGLVIILLTEALRRVYSVFYLQLNRPDWMDALHIAPGLTASTLVGIFLLVLATKFDGEKPSKLPGTLAAVIAFLGVMLSSALPYFIAKFILIWTAIGKLGVIFLPH